MIDLSHLFEYLCHQSTDMSHKFVSKISNHDKSLTKNQDDILKIKSVVTCHIIYYHIKILYYIIKNLK